jgi:predicted metal-binding protein
VRVSVCVTCGRTEGSAETAGARLLAALAPALAAAGAPVEAAAVECLSVCKRPCTIAASGPGRWTYVWGDIDPDADLAAVVDGLSRYAAAPDGLVPWRERPERFRKGVVARIPPLPRGSP